MQSICWLCQKVYTKAFSEFLVLQKKKKKKSQNCPLKSCHVLGLCIGTEQKLYILLNSTSSDQEVIREMKVHESFMSATLDSPLPQRLGRW